MIRFFNFFLDHMVQKYQNEILPIFYYGISTKTSEKDLKIPNLQALTLGCIIKMTLYDQWQSPVAGAASDWRRGAPATRPMPPPPPPATQPPSLARGEVTWMITMAWMMIILLIPLMLQKGRNLTLIRQTMRNVSRKLSYKMNKLRLRLRPWDWQMESRHQNDIMPWKLGHND